MYHIYKLLVLLLALALTSGIQAGDRVNVDIDKAAVITSPQNDENRSLAKFDFGETIKGRHVEYAAVEIQFEVPADSAEYYTAFIFPLKKAFSTGATWSDNFTREGVDYYKEYGLSVLVTKRDGYKARVFLNELAELWADGTIENHGFIIVSPKKGLGKAKIQTGVDAVSKMLLYHEKAD